MIRTYAEWEHDARTTTKSVTQLGNELRTRWDDWKMDAPYKTFDECILAELGITAHALRIRNSKARGKATVSNGDGSQPATPQPPRQVAKRTDPAEVERRRNHAAKLWREGYIPDEIAPILDVSRRTIQTDLAAKGAEGRRNGPRQVKPNSTPEGDFRWRNQDLGISDEESTIEQPSFAACETPSASEAIEDVRIQLALITGGRYHLSLKDRNNLITILTNALERLHNGNQENSDTEGARQGARVAG